VNISGSAYLTSGISIDFSFLGSGSSSSSLPYIIGFYKSN
jgi:hypothetical protein